MAALLVAFLVAFGATLVLTPLVRRRARQAGLVARPREDRWHRQPTALFGGVAIFGGLAAASLVAMPLVLRYFPDSFDPAVLAVFTAAVLMFGTGLADDRFVLRPGTKLVVQILAAGAVVTLGVIYPISAWTPLNVVFTMFWFLAITNALNLLDNMDGVSAGIAGLAALFLAAIFAIEGAWLLATLGAALAGAAFGFLPYNFAPASIFMGDSGSLLLGAVLAALAAAYPDAASAGLVPVLFVPLFIVVIPLMDTALVTISRILAGRPVSVGGRDHTTHRLVAMGLSERTTAILLYSFAAVGGGLALFIRYTDASLGLWSTALFFVALAILAAYLGKLHKYTPSEIDRPQARITVLVTDLLHKKRALEIMMDMLLFAAAYTGAHLLRYEGAVPADQLSVLEHTLALVVGFKSVSFAIGGVYRVNWNQITIHDIHRLFKAVALGSVLTLIGVFFLYRDLNLARGVLVLDTLLVLVLTGTARVSFRSLDLVRSSLSRRSGRRTLIYGAGMAGELVVRELLSNHSLSLRPIGFLDDDPDRDGRLLHGLKVRSVNGSLRSIMEREKVEAIVIAIRTLEGERLQEIAGSCAESGVEVLQFTLDFKPVAGPAAKAPRPAPVAEAPRVASSPETVCQPRGAVPIARSEHAR